MKIKEIETLTGMSRDNIRFYEKCGLLIPNRNENGYRDYNEDDATTLKRIKLLRSLHLSIEDIKDIQTNKIDLVNHLDEHIKRLEEEKVDLDKSMKACRQMILDHVTYNNLDAQEYLQYFDTNDLKEDVIPRFKSPIRRYFARAIDINIYNLFVQCFIILVIGARTSDNIGMQIVDTILTLVLILVFEPFLLSKFMTTPGKALLGLKILDEDGNKLSYKAAFDRTLNIIIYGYGCFIPIIALICNFISYRKCNKNEELRWEEGNVQTANDIKPVHIISTIIFYIGYLVIAVLLAMQSLLPPNRGELTISEFAQNCNYIQELNEDTPLVKLDNNGNWIPIEIEDGFSVGSYFMERYPQLHYVVENNEVVEISFSIENESDLFKLIYFGDIRGYIISSYLKAQESYSIFDSNAGSIAIMFYDHDNFEYEAYGVEMIQEKTKSKNLEDIDQYSISFTIRKK